MPENQAKNKNGLDGRREGLVSGGLMRIQEAAQFLGLSRASVYKIMDKGDLPWVKLGRARRVPRKAVVDLAARLVQGGDVRDRGASDD